MNYIVQEFYKQWWKFVDYEMNYTWYPRYFNKIANERISKFPKISYVLLFYQNQFK